MKNRFYPGQIVYLFRNPDALRKIIGFHGIDDHGNDLWKVEYGGTIHINSGYLYSSLIVEPDFSSGI